ncbi:hypothetical protein SAMN05444008_111117 [Cnuella takakiae]|uniref:Uncharacterized protein n=1 Tax=Cnuella takakiae TaxID=1302690 RepID=A0A1M5DX42_9BACT|nr:hypothetical protein SAMN05444008_111117 [Cnuella takakiae]
MKYLRLFCFKCLPLLKGARLKQLYTLVFGGFSLPFNNPLFAKETTVEGQGKSPETDDT